MQKSAWKNALLSIFVFIYICTHIYYSLTNETWNFPLFKRFTSFNIWIFNLFNSSSSCKIISLGSSVYVSLLQILIILVSSTYTNITNSIFILWWIIFGKYHSPFIWSTHTCILKNIVFFQIIHFNIRFW